MAPPPSSSKKRKASSSPCSLSPTKPSAGAVKVAVTQDTVVASSSLTTTSTTAAGSASQRSILAYGRISKARRLLERKVEWKVGKEGGVVDDGGGGMRRDDGDQERAITITVHGDGRDEECPQPAAVERVVVIDEKEKSAGETSAAPQTPRKRIRTVTPRTPSSATESRGKSLIERIREKELRRSALPPPPSKAEMERRFALERLPEIVSILNCLCISTHNDTDADAKSKTTTKMKGGRKRQQQQQQQKISFPLPVLVQHLQHSLRNPISREEGERGIRLLAEEVAPDWIELMTMGKGEVIAAVLNRGRQPGRLELRRRLDGVLLDRSHCERVVL